MTRIECRARSLPLANTLAMAFLLIAAVALLPPTASSQDLVQDFSQDFGPDFGMGAVFDADAFDRAPRTGPLARGNYTSIPEQVSLRHYAPTPGHQGQQGSCVGWATAYAARTLAHANLNSLSPQPAIDAQRFSPSYIYNQIFYREPGFSDAENCLFGGANLIDALQLMTTEGVVPLDTYPYDEASCFQPISPSLRGQAGTYAIDSYARLFDRFTQAKHVPVKRSIAANRPVIFGMTTPDSFHSAAGVWSPTAGDLDQIADNRAGGHAMTVVGYDDSRGGGAFEVINSWGTGWGNDGFIWIDYEAFNFLAQEAFEIIPPPPDPAPYDPAPPDPALPEIADLEAWLDFKHIGGETMAAQPWEGRPGAFRLSESWPSGTRFRVELTSGVSNYIYVLGGDMTGRYGPIFPQAGISAHAGAGDTLLLPGPTEDYFTRLDDTVGTDFYIALISKEQLDVTGLAARMTEAGGNVFDRLERVLGDSLVDANDIGPLEMTAVGPGIGIQAISRDRAVAPIVVAIDHVAPDPVAPDTRPPEIVLRTPAPDVFDTIATGRDHRRVHSREFRIEGIAQDESAIDRIEVSNASSSRFSSRGPFEAQIILPSGPGPHPVTIHTSDVHGNESSQTFMFEIMN